MRLVEAGERHDGLLLLLLAAELDPVAAADALDRRGEVDRHGEDEAAGVVAVTADEVDAPGGPDADPGHHRTSTARRSDAACSGTTGLTYWPLPSSIAAT